MRLEFKKKRELELLGIKELENEKIILNQHVNGLQNLIDNYDKSLSLFKKELIEFVKLYKKYYLFAKNNSKFVDDTKSENSLLIFSKTTQVKKLIISNSAKSEMAGIRAGRASPGMLDSLKIEAYGQKMAINQLGNVTTPDSRTISIDIWDQSNVSLVEKSIRESDLGINPMIEGNLIRLPLPQLTEERRLEFLKIAGKISENAKIAIRNIRRDAIEKIKTFEKNKELGQDESKKYQSTIENITSEHVKMIDTSLKNKEEDLKNI